jgi:hypothetical protein
MINRGISQGAGAVRSDSWLQRLAVSSEHIALRAVSAMTQFSACTPMRVEVTAVTIKRNCRMGNQSDLTNEVFHGI